MVLLPQVTLQRLSSENDTAGGQNHTVSGPTRRRPAYSGQDVELNNPRESRHDLDQGGLPSSGSRTRREL